MFFVVAAAAPLTVMAGIAPLAIMIGGISAPAGYLIAGLILTVFAVAFTAMSKYIHNAGAFYSYIARGLGKPTGLGAAALAVFSYNAIQIGLYGAFGYFAATTAKDLTGLDLPWWAWSAIGIAVVWFFGYRSIHAGAKILGGLLIAETGILALLAAAILVKGGAHGLSLASFAPAHVVTGGMGSVLALAFGAFIGFEATAIYREEARCGRPQVRSILDMPWPWCGRLHPDVTIEQFGEASANKWFTTRTPRTSSVRGGRSFRWRSASCCWCLGALVAALLTLTAFFAANGQLGLIGHAMNVDESASSVMPPMGTMVGVDYCLFYLSREGVERAGAGSRRRAADRRHRRPVGADLRADRHRGGGRRIPGRHAAARGLRRRYRRWCRPRHWSRAMCPTSGAVAVGRGSRPGGVPPRRPQPCRLRRTGTVARTPGRSPSSTVPLDVEEQVPSAGSGSASSPRLATRPPSPPRSGSRIS